MTDLETPMNDHEVHDTVAEEIPRDTPQEEPKEDPKEEAEEVYDVEALLDHRVSTKKQVRLNTVEYLIKWHNYGDDQNTWENESNIFSEALVNDYWASIGSSKEEFLKAETEKRKKRVKKSKTSSDKEPKRQKRTASEESKSSDSRKKKAKVDSFILSVTEPPKGLTWDDISVVEDIFTGESNELFSQIKWKSGQVTYCSNKLLRKHAPIPLLEYYEGHLEFQYCEGEPKE
ncbi:hypothetical protein CLU79DRAFT_721173 [Phycomyces nitens]|nr:hypothetical protein CLU79DRAFT_721173 [Phycomyces nitens]